MEPGCAKVSQGPLPSFTEKILVGTEVNLICHLLKDPSVNIYSALPVSEDTELSAREE